MSKPITLCDKHLSMYQEIIPMDKDDICPMCKLNWCLHQKTMLQRQVKKKQVPPEKGALLRMIHFTKQLVADLKEVREGLEHELEKMRQ